jgi:hypothetical protein
LKSQGQAPIYLLRASLPVEIEHWLTASDIVFAAMHLSDLKPF